MLKIKDSQSYEFVWRNNGVLPVEPVEGQDSQDSHEVAQVTMKDALNTSDAPIWFPTTVENFVREAIEPRAIGSSILQRINFKVGQTISLPSVGTMYAADVDEGMEYPERTLNFGPGARIATVNKSGLAFKITEEQIMYNQFDVVRLMIRQAGLALIRHKEQKIWNMMKSQGIITHDNVTPANSIFGTTTGRNEVGTKNGSLALDNIYEAYGQLMLNGYNADTLIVHPLTFTTFMTDPVLRSMAIYTGNTSQWFHGPAGVLNKDPWAKGAMQGMGPRGGTKGTHPLAQASPLGGNAALNEYNQNLVSGMEIPNYLGLGLRVVVSPYMYYDPVKRTADMILCDSSVAGALIVAEEPVMDTTADALRDLTKVKIRERYTVVSVDEGRGVAVIKNVKVTPNQMLPASIASVTLTGGGAAAIDRTAGLTF